MNRIKCAKCGDLLHSKHRHDFQRCSCGAVAVDGGDEDVTGLNGCPNDIILVADDGTEKPFNDVTKQVGEIA